MMLNKKSGKMKTSRQLLRKAAVIFGAVCQDAAQEIEGENPESAKKIRRLKKQFHELYEELKVLIPRADARPSGCQSHRSNRIA